MSNISNLYQKKTDKQHVLDSPDTYTGSMDITEYNTYIYDNNSNKIIQKNINIIPGLYKLFDEGIVNCRDHYIRMQTKKEDGAIQVTNIDIEISDDGIITLTNNGNGIDVVKHPEYDLWVPEMIFGHLRTSTNYDKTQKKIIGGKNGFGFKLVLIWSSWGRIETVDHNRKKKYIQEFNDNLNIIHKPSITKCSKKPYTKVSFKPDYKRLGIDNLSEEMIHLFKRRVYDIAAITDKSVKVKYNNELVPVRTFAEYVNLYIGNKNESKRCYESYNDRWEYVVGLSPNEEFTQVSFVNGIFTRNGGKHVDYILNQIVKKLIIYIKKKKKVEVKSSTIKEQLILFLRCDIENPSFDSQTKDYLNTTTSKFGSKCVVSDSFIDKIAKIGVMNSACALTNVKEQIVAKKNDGSKTKSIRGIPKLIDANYAGTSKSKECIIILCEGDSAKAGIVSGLSKLDRNYIGIYPMRGKLLNIRGETTKKIGDNKEITEIKKIIGLQNNKVYDIHNINTLRYGKIVFMTDQDLDGIHIKGLGINMFESQWNSLLKINGFISFMNTPIIRAKKGNNEIIFYNDGEYNTWKNENNTNGWKIKYYKGLGTSTSKEFKEYFKNKKFINFNTIQDNCKDSIDMVFNKKRASDRKIWLENYNKDVYLDTNDNNITYESFIHREMIHFSKYDCERSIPNIMDGLKTSQRKILYSSFKKNLKNEIKVAQFSGYVSENSLYHHGEQSLNSAIVNMAQNFVGSNNINLFNPNGQFGTRLQGGKDSASERYIFTNLNNVSRFIYKEEDDNVINYNFDDGIKVEPIYYVPIIPMILVNGTKGIGTGFSTDIMCYNPLSIIHYLETKINNDNTDDIDIEPYYKGFNGTIHNIHNNKYIIKGTYTIVNDNKVNITELPIGVWTDTYKVFLENNINLKKSLIKDYIDLSTEVNVDITVIFNKGAIQDLLTKKHEHNCNGIEQYLKLYVSKSSNNMHLFDENEKLKLFNNPKEIIDHYYNIRYKTYVDRKQAQLSVLQKQACLLTNKARFISENLNDTIDLRRMKKQEVFDLLSSRNYDIIEDDNEYKYLIKMSMDSVTQENIIKLNNDKDKINVLIDDLLNTSELQIWCNELQELKNLLKHFK
jgi:DNA topoisomerase-2